jgi:ABC-2 type transport system permease protein
MWVICRKEWQQFFSHFSSYFVLGVFLVLSGIMFFVIPSFSLFDFGYATLQLFFIQAPWLLLFLVPAITMRSLPEEYKTGTIEILKTLPFTNWQIVWGKFAGVVIILFFALFPTILYAFSLQQLSASGTIETGATVGSYIGLFLLGAVFCAVGICVGSFTDNTVVCFCISALACVILYAGLDALSHVEILTSRGLDYYMQMLGIKFHYFHISRGVIDARDILYFLGLIALLLFITQKKMDTK